MLIPAISEHLTGDDDSELWDVATNTILSDIIHSNDPDAGVVAEVGCCNHWIRPHQMRWKADGGFASPFGYDKTTTGFSFRALPEFEWSVLLRRTGTTWESASTHGRCRVLRIAIPGRTARHLQAAIHTIWMPRSRSGEEKLVRLYGFRKKGSTWHLTATYARGDRSRTKDKKSLKSRNGK